MDTSGQRISEGREFNVVHEIWEMRKKKTHELGYYFSPNCFYVHDVFTARYVRMSHISKPPQPRYIRISNILNHHVCYMH